MESKRHDAFATWDMIREMRGSTRKNFLGSQGVRGFQTFLKRKYGSVLNGWRHIDEASAGRVTQGEFVNACRRIGFHGDIKFVWRELDFKGTGVIGLAEIDHMAGFAVGEFKYKLMQEYGDMLTAWRAVDANHSGNVSEYELYQSLQRLGLGHLDCSVLYKALLCAPQKQLHRNEPLGLTIEQFDPKAAIAARCSTEVFVKNRLDKTDDFRWRAPSMAMERNGSKDSVASSESKGSAWSRMPSLQKIAESRRASKVSQVEVEQVDES
jgi:Ca2+-binding EF-hand superfamily protein